MRFSPRRSSTADSSPERADRRASRYVRGRADLQGFADFPVRVSTTCSASARAGTALRASPERRRSSTGDRARLAGQHAGLRRREGLATAGSRGNSGSSVHGRTADETPRTARRHARQSRANHDQRSQGAVPAVPATRVTKPPCCGSKSRYSSFGFSLGDLLSVVAGSVLALATLLN